MSHTQWLCRFEYISNCIFSACNVQALADDLTAGNTDVLMPIDMIHVTQPDKLMKHKNRNRVGEIYVSAECRQQVINSI